MGDDVELMRLQQKCANLEKRLSSEIATHEETTSAMDALRERVRALEEQIQTERQQQHERLLEVMAERDKARLDAKVAWEAHREEKAARDGWVQSYREALARAERAETAVVDARAKTLDEAAEEAEKRRATAVVQADEFRAFGRDEVAERSDAEAKAAKRIREAILALKQR